MPTQETTIKTSIQSDISATASSDLSVRLKALAHPSRLEIIRQLASRDRCCAGDFCDCLPLAQSTISQHLEMLCSSGLVISQQSGTRSIFTLNPERLVDLANALVTLAQSPCYNSDNRLDKPEKQ